MQIEVTCRWSVPQQPPRTFTRGRLGLSAGVPLAQVGRIALVQLRRLLELGVAPSSFERALAEKLLPGVKSALGSDPYAAAEASGRRLSLEDALAEASPAGT